MKVLMISSDRNILNLNSSVRERIKEYGDLVDELHIILMSDKKHSLVEEKISSKVFVYPTNSMNKILRPFNALQIGKRLNFDLITTQDPFECGWVGMRLKRARRVPLEVQLHTDMFSSQFNGVLNVIRKLISRFVISYADSIRVVTESLGEEVKKRFNVNSEKITVLPIFVNRKNIDGEAGFDLHDKYGFRTVILSVSRLEPEKDLELAIRVFADIFLDYPHTGFIIVGSGSTEPQLKRLVKELGLEKNVVFVGWQDELVSYYKTADIYLQTSVFEGYGLSLIEAGLNGLPIVTTPVGIARDLDKVLIAQDKDIFVRNLELLINDEGKRRNIGEELKNELQRTVLTKDLYMKRLRENWVKLC